MRTTPTPQLDDIPVAISGRKMLLLLAGAIGGAVLAAVVMPALVPGLARSLLGEEPKAFWYLSRSSAFVAYILTWLSMLLGLMITNKMARVWPGGPVAYDLHQHFSLLGLVFAVFHAFILLGDRYIGYNLAQLLIPFASTDFQPLWVGIGQLGLYGFAALALSFYVRETITTRGWRLIHYLSFAVFAGALLHSAFSGSDSATPLASALYWASGASVLYLTVVRVARRVRNGPAQAPTFPSV